MTQLLDGLSQYGQTDSGIYAPPDDPVALLDEPSRFDRLWIGTVTGFDPTSPAGLAMRGVTRGAVTSGMLLGASAGEITAELYRYPNMTTLLQTLNLSRRRTWQDLLSEPGSGQIVLQNDDTDLASFVGDGDDLVLLRYAGQAAFMLMCESSVREVVPIEEEAGETTTWTGRGHLALLERAEVYPTGGVGRRPIEDDRPFNWTSPALDDSGWALATTMNTAGGAKTGWNGGPGPYFDADFPDNTALVLWASSGAATTAPTGACYFRQDITVPTAGLHTIYLATDNHGDLYVDGQLIVESDDFVEMTQLSIELSVGTHLVAVRGFNDALGTDNANDPAGITWAIYSTNPATGADLALIAHSDATCRIVEYPPEPPGMTPGQVMNVVLDECQARGILTGIVRTWTDDVDSDGVAWPFVDIATKTGTDLLTFFREMAATHIDFWLEPGTLRLFAYDLAGRGATRAITLAAGSNITSMSLRRSASPIDAVLARWHGGWAERTDPGSITTYGRREVTLGLGALDSLAEVYRVTDAHLTVFATPRLEYTIGVHPSGDTDRPYRTWRVGDTLTIPDGSGGTVAGRAFGFPVSEDDRTGRALIVAQFGDELLTEEARVFQALKKMVNGTQQGEAKFAQPVALSGLFEVRRIPKIGAGAVTETFTYTGACVDWTVPTGITSVTVDAYGAAGSVGEGVDAGDGGLGGRVRATIVVTAGETLRVCVGGAGVPGLAGTGGFNGGGMGGQWTTDGGAGGGASDVRRSPYALGDRLVVGGGGGGGSGNGGGPPRPDGGGGGYPTGIDGGSGANPPNGDGGTQAAGGTRGSAANPCLGGTAAEDGVLGDGGDATQGLACAGVGAGGGGGGYYGGGGGGTELGGGGGGSGFYDPAATGITTEDAVLAGNGLVTISYAALT